MKISNGHPYPLYIRRTPWVNLKLPWYFWDHLTDSGNPPSPCPILSVAGNCQANHGHGDNSELLENSEILELFGRTIPNAILPFSCSSHHGSLRSSRNFKNLSIIKNFQVPSYQFFVLYIKMTTRNFSDYGPINL